MNRQLYLKKIIEEFCDWYIKDQHYWLKDYYKDKITKQYLESLSNVEFINFFYEFVSEGGKVQSGGARRKNDFLETIENDLKSFKSFIMEPFDKNFDLKGWFLKIDSYPYFGVGIATIYLNRINYHIYSIMNNKTLNALNKLGYEISHTKNWANYLMVYRIQKELIAEFPVLENLYKADALNHFIIEVYKGQGLIENYIRIESFLDEVQQNEIEHNLKAITDRTNPDELYRRIKACEKEDSELITIEGKVYKRHNYLMVQIKRYRKYKCQFCSTTIQKENGSYYIEACHINAKAKGGKDALNNILVLCPNCHKLFDFGKKVDEKICGDNYSVILNGRKYEASIV